MSTKSSKKMVDSEVNQTRTIKGTEGAGKKDSNIGANNSSGENTKFISTETSDLSPELIFKPPVSKKRYFIIILTLLAIYSVNMVFFSLNSGDSRLFIDLTRSICVNPTILTYVIIFTLVIILSGVLSSLMSGKWVDRRLNIKKIIIPNTIEVNGNPFAVKKVENYSIQDLEDRYFIEAEIVGEFLE